MDPTLADSVVPEQVINCIKIGLLCAQFCPDSRPSMDHVVSMLTGNQNLMGMQIDGEIFTSTTSFDFDGVEELVDLRQNFSPI